MNEQMTPQAITVLVVGLVVFWLSIAVMVRAHRVHRTGHRAAPRAPETRG